MKGRLFHFWVSFVFVVIFIATYGPAVESAPTPNFPTRAIVWIVPYSPGGGFDRISRGIARTMQKHLGVPVVIKNAPGAGGLTGTSVIYRSRPDGYTVGIINVRNMQFTQTLRKVHFDLGKTTWLGLAATQHTVLVVPESSPFRSVDDLKKASRPARLGATGKASAGYFSGVITGKVLKIPFATVLGYRGAAGIMTALLRGDIDWTTTPTDSTILPFYKAGGLRILFYFGKERSKVLPNVPSIVELGHPELSDVGTNVRGVAGPPGIPRERVRILEGAFLKTLKDPEFLAWAKKAGFAQDIKPLSGQEFKARFGDLPKVYLQYKDYFR